MILPHGRKNAVNLPRNIAQRTVQSKHAALCAERLGRIAVTFVEWSSKDRQDQVIDWTPAPTSRASISREQTFRAIFRWLSSG